LSEIFAPLVGEKLDDHGVGADEKKAAPYADDGEEDKGGGKVAEHAQGKGADAVEESP